MIRTDAPVVSLVVSTCNRAGRLGLLFDALAQQTLNGRLAWEAIFVDNRSTDDTAQVIERFRAQAAFPVTCVFEGRQGKSYGVNTGIGLARGKVIAFTDDDCVPAPDWLESLLRHFERNPETACVGGRVEIYDPADALVTVRLSTVEARVDAGNFAPGNIPIIGSNMAVRADAFREIGLYDTDTGPGSRIGVAEDVDMLYRLVRGGLRVDYDPAAVVLHNHGRRTPTQVEQVLRGYLIGRGAFYCKYILRGDRTALRWAFWELRSLLIDALRCGGFSARALVAWRSARLLVAGGIRYLRFRSRSSGSEGIVARGGLS